MSDLPANTLEAHGLLYTLTLIRVATFIAMVPMFGGRNVPRLVKVALAISLASLWVPRGELDSNVAVVLSDATYWPLYLVLAGREMLVGAVFGYAFGLFLLPARIAGAYVGQEMGFTLGAIADPTSGDSGNVISVLFDALSVLIFLTLDLHRNLFLTLHATLAKFPVATWAIPTGIDGLARGLSLTQTWGMLVAAPIAICLFLNLVVMAILTKVSPQLNLFSVGLTLRILVGIAAILAFLPELLYSVSQIYGQLVARGPTWSH